MRFVAFVPGESVVTGREDDAVVAEQELSHGLYGFYDAFETTTVPHSTGVVRTMTERPAVFLGNSPLLC